MHIDTDSITTDKIFSQVFNQLLNNKKKSVKVQQKQFSDEEIKELIHKEIPEFELEKVIEGLNKIAAASEILNKRVELRVNKEINRVIITIIDKESNKVIKEIPCQELQNLALHLKEAIGILFDKSV